MSYTFHNVYAYGISLIYLNWSAMPASTKPTTLVQLCATMLRNTRQELRDKLWISLMENLVETMFISGHPEVFRRSMTESTVKCFEKQVAASLRGETPFYRPRAWQSATRQRNKLRAKSVWFRPAHSVMRVPCTPGSVLGGSQVTLLTAGPCSTRRLLPIGRRKTLLQSTC